MSQFAALSNKILLVLGLLLILVIGAFLFFYRPATQGTPVLTTVETESLGVQEAVAAPDTSPARILDAVNQARQKEGLPILASNEKLTQAARAKAVDMCQKEYWSHESPDGKEPWTWIQQADYQYAAAGENLGKDFFTVEELLSAWIASPSHKENMFSSVYTETGVARSGCLFNGVFTKIVVQMFARPAF